MLKNAIDLTPYALDPRGFDTRALAHWLESTLATPNAAAKAAQLELYAKTLLEWNTSHNLSGAHTMEDMLRQIVDSALPLCVIKPFSRCLDIGSGAGLPALVLGILRPDSHFILCEPRKKRAAFLRIVGHKLGLRNLQVQATRIEHLALSYQADLITSRASLPNDIIFATTKPLLQPNGAYLLYKGERSYHIGLVDEDWAFGLESRISSPHFVDRQPSLISLCGLKSHDSSSKILESQSGFTKQAEIKTTALKSTFESPTAKQATAVQGEAAAGFFRTPRILEKDNQAECEKSTKNKKTTDIQKVDSSKQAHFLSLRENPQGFSWQSIQKYPNTLESTFQQNSHSPTAKRSFFRKQGIPLAVRRCFFRKQATAVQGGGTQADFFSKKPTPKITLYRYNARIYVYKELAQCLD